MDVSIYKNIKEALCNQIKQYLVDQGIKDVDVYPTSYQNISMFPAVALEIDKRRKPKVGLKVRRLELDFNIWVYTNIMDAEDSEIECLNVMEVVEKAIESDKTLQGTCQYLTIDSEAEFGTVANGEASFLQGVRLPLTVNLLVN